MCMNIKTDKAHKQVWDGTLYLYNKITYSIISASLIEQQRT